MGLIPGQGTKILHAAWPNKTNKQTKRKYDPHHHLDLIKMKSSQQVRREGTFFLLLPSAIPPPQPTLTPS